MYTKPAWLKYGLALDNTTIWLYGDHKCPPHDMVAQYLDSHTEERQCWYEVMFKNGHGNYFDVLELAEKQINSNP